MATLVRKDYSTVNWTSNELDQILAYLTAGRATGCNDGSDIFFMAASPYLLIVDVTFGINRKLTELFDLRTDPTMPFNLRFEQDQVYFSLSDALYACGYTGQPATTSVDLARVFMTIYDSRQGLGFADNIGTGVQLVAHPGNPQSAQIRSLTAGRLIQLSQGADSITVSTPIDVVSGAGISVTNNSGSFNVRNIFSSGTSGTPILTGSWVVRSLVVGSSLTCTSTTTIFSWTWQQLSLLEQVSV